MPRQAISNHRVARVWKRILAFLLDLYLGLMVFSAFLLIVQSELPSTISGVINAGLTPLAVAAIFYASAWVLLYHVFSEYVVGQTPGMLVFGLSVVGPQRKNSISFGQALLRNIFIIPFFPFTIFWAVDPIYYVFSGERLLERWSKTQTVERMA
jgi:uncharacterized RDD family membrane protein YckC